MENCKKVLISFCLYLFTFLLIVLVGVSNVFASSYDALSFTAQLYDNYGPSLSPVTTSMSNMYYTGTIPTMTANSSGAAWGISSPIPLLANHTYSLSVKIEGNYGGNIRLSTYNRIGVGTSLGNAKSSYENNSNVTENYSNVVTSNMTLQFAFTPSINSTYIVFPFATTYTGNNQEFRIYYVVIDDLGASGVSQSTINNSLNNQTNIINNSISSSTNTITSNSNANKDAIINNQNANNEALIQNDNANTDKLIEDNKKNFQTCRDSNNLINKNNLTIGYISNDGSLHTGGGSSYTTNILNLGNGTFTLSGGRLQKICFYNDDDSFSSCNILSSELYTFTLTDFKKVRFQFDTISVRNLMLNKGNSALSYEPYGEQICKNKLDEQTDAINGLNDNINDDNTDGASSEASEFFSSFNTDTFGLTSIITAPLNLIKSLTSKTCTPLHIPLPYLNNKYLDLPCMSSIYSQYFGSFFTLYQTITYGIIAYWVCVRIFNLVKDFKNPEHDEIEVLDL